MIPLLIVISILLVVLIALTCYLIFKQPTPIAVPPDTRIDTLLVESKNNSQSNREDLAALRREQQEQASTLRSELDRRLELNNQTILGRLDESRRDALTQAETTRKALDARLIEARDEADKTLAALRSEATEAAATTRAENRQQFSEIQQVLRTSLEDARTAQGEQGKAIDYQRFVEASEKADAEGIASAGSALELRLRSSARDIATKYVASPHTTDFAILYLPTEGLYAEALRRAGLVESLQQQHHVLLAGPMTLAALLNSLQMGFRTLAIQQRSSEVWQVLGAVKTEFAKFGDVIAKVKKKLDEASSQIDQTGVRSRAIERRLRSVETLPADDVARLLPELTEGVPEPEGDSTS